MVEKVEGANKHRRLVLVLNALPNNLLLLGLECGFGLEQSFGKSHNWHKQLPKLLSAMKNAAASFFIAVTLDSDLLRFPCVDSAVEKHYEACGGNG